MTRFTAMVRHNAQTIGRMCRVQRDTFRFGDKIGMALGGLALTVLGAWNLNSVMGLVFAMVGCWMLVSLNWAAKTDADRIREALKGQYPTNSYVFEEHQFTLKAENNDLIAYSKLVRLVEDDHYAYLFINEQAAYMLEKASLEPEWKEFRAFMETATGLTWTKPYSLATFNLHTVLRMIKESTSANDQKKSKNKKNKKNKKKQGV